MFGPQVNRVWCPKKEGRPQLAREIATALQHARSHGRGGKVAQIFVFNPHTGVPTLKPEEQKGLKEYLKTSGVTLLIHGAYTFSLWSGKKRALGGVNRELRIAADIGSPGVVIHLGKTPRLRLVEVLKTVTIPQNTLLFLETPAVKPANAYFTTPREIAVLFLYLRLANIERIGLCIDTAHLWATGVDLSSYEAAEDWLQQLELYRDIIPLDRVAFHLNDSFEPLGSGRDVHAPFLQGKIWEAYRDEPADSGLNAFVDFIDRHGCPAILERRDPNKKITDPRAALQNDYEVLAELI